MCVRFTVWPRPICTMQSRKQVSASGNHETNKKGQHSRNARNNNNNIRARVVVMMPKKRSFWFWDFSVCVFVCVLVDAQQLVNIDFNCSIITQQPTESQSNKHSAH